MTGPQQARPLSQPSDEQWAPAVGSMEGNGRLLRVIRELRGEVRELERENRALHAELSRAGPVGAVRPLEVEKEEGSRKSSAPEEAPAPAALRRNVSAASSLERQEQKGNTMTVRRYSISASVHAGAGNAHHRQSKRNSSHRSHAVQGIGRLPMSPTAVERIKDEDSISNCPADHFSNKKITSIKSFQDYMYKCRGKVKSVTFLLPIDTAYSENQVSFKNPPNQSTNQLSTITEKDS
ncbi:putative coiled-coil domain-containing protein 195 [Rhinatrema bivittatum]|uniref:putative coiled-coil domain-containing protein 195 n=1 Tax=Rhinatrema bivittatum TaxID=194408 RepID=UPI001126E98E|nr:putative coiled-coil domain-containing protein 195 [Rhinatrema bivittatum]